MCLEGFLGKRISSIGHSSPWYPPQWFTSAYRGSPPPTRFYLVGQLTRGAEILSYNTDTDIDDKATDSYSYNKDNDVGIGKGYL